MSKDNNANSSDDDGEYYSRVLRRIVRNPTPVLFNMIKELVNQKDVQILLSCYKVLV